MNYPYWQEISFYLNEIQKEQLEFGSNPITSESIDEIRRKIVLSVDQLKGILEQRLDKHHASLALFSVVALVDEEMQNFDYSKVKTRWAPLSKDFYAAYTAGELFFETIDKILEDPTVPSIVYEIYYFVLKRGFKGKHRETKTQLYKYLELLKSKIPVPIPQVQTHEPTSTFIKEEKKKKWKYYGTAFGLFVMIYLALYIYSNFDR